MKPQEIEDASLKDTLTYGISYIDLGQGHKWAISDRPWLPQIYQVVNPYTIERFPLGQCKRMVVIKSAQCGLSTMGIVRTFHFADFWATRIGYMLPRQMDVLDFVGTRVDPMIRSSPRLSKLLGVPDSAHAKRLGNSFIYYMEASVEPRMIPLDMLMADEVDLCDLNNVAVGRNRMDASTWKLEFHFSTPTVTNYGIHAMYINSDQRKWLVRCPHCNHDQEMSWNDNVLVVGPRNNPKRVFYGCAKCKDEITLQDIRAGRWVAEKPDRSKKVIGFHISQMMIYPADHLYEVYLDPQTKLVEFYRKNLGMPYDIGGGNLEREDFLVNCFDDPYSEEDYPDKKARYYLGADQGNELQVIIGKLDDDSNQIKIVHIELIPFEDGFNRLAKLIRLFKIKRGVGDANPNRHSMDSVCKDFPGKMVMADYVEQRKRLSIKKNDKGVVTNVNLQRTQAFDHLLESVRKGGWQLPGIPPELPPDVELLISHVTALRRDIETRKTSAGEVQVGVYRNIRPEHLAHAMAYLQTAVELDKVSSFRTEVIDLDALDQVEEEEQITEYGLEATLLKEITALLAEVPTPQLEGYHEHWEDPDYLPPFPLSYKLERCMAEEYSLEDILATVQSILDDRKRIL